MKWWTPPKQRQRWGDSLILPSGTWGQVFFDLFYVGGCINLGTILKENTNSRTILYFAGAGLPVMMMWFDKMYYDARFTTRPGHDVCHRLWDVFQILVVASGLSRLRSVDVLKNHCEHADMFQLCCALLLNSISTIFKYLEVVYFVEGDPAAKVVAKRDINCRVIPTILLILATFESGFAFFGAYDGECEYASDKPIWYCWASWLSWAVIGYLDTVTCAPKQRMVEISVPMNVNFCIHRYGEWFMLMFGESIISLLIVDGNNESISYGVAFFSGILSVIFLAHLHYSGEPHLADHHALSRSRHSNFVYIVLVPIYSIALIAIGTSYKLFLHEFTSKTSYDETESRKLADYGYTSDIDEAQYVFQLEQRQRYAANLFSGSIALVLILLDVKQVLHRGLPAIQRQARTVSLLRLILFVLLKYSLVVFLATLSMYQHDPNIMTFCGLCSIIVQEILYNFFFQHRGVHNETKPNKKLDDQDDDDMTWFSVTSAAFTSVADDGRQNGGLAVFERDSLYLDGLLGPIDEATEEEPSGIIATLPRNAVLSDEPSPEWKTRDTATIDYSRMAEF